MRKTIALVLPFVLTGCLPDSNDAKTKELEQRISKLEEKQVTSCYEAVSANHDVQPQSMVMVDKCTGVTWILVKTPLGDDKGKRTRSFTYQWKKVTYDFTNPLILSYPTMNELADQVK